MAVTLAPDELRDAEVTDGIGLGDVGCAARLWVRYWPTALGAARQYVDPEEVPGLAAEALVGTITAIAIGRGPREDVAGFVADAVRELGEDDEPAPSSDTSYPDLFVSAMMTDAFAALDEETRGTIRTATYEQVFDYESDAALTVLQHYYLAEHADRAETSTCRRTHIALMATADGSVTDGLSGENWLHLSTCAWCTEAFHEIAFSSVALDALVAPSVWEQAAPVVAPAVAATEPDLYEDLFGEPVAEPIDEQVDEQVDEKVDEKVEEPVEEQYDELPAPPEDDEDVAFVATGTRRGRRRVVAGAILTAAAVAIVAVLVSGLGGGDGTSPTAASANPTESTAADVPTESSTPDVATTPTPSETASVAGPSETPTTASVETPAAEEPTSTPTSKPTKSSPKPSPTPTAKPTPTTSPTTATPTPTPTAKPTKRCNPLQHLLGLC